MQDEKFRPSFVEWCLLLYSILYAAVSRAPFTLFALYMVDVKGFTFLEAALTIGLYCFGRLVGADIAGRFVGIVTLLSGTILGGVAWLLILYIDQKWVFIASCFILGQTETVTGLDTMLKMEALILDRLQEHTQLVFRCQLIFTCFGVFIAYMVFGLMYEKLGFASIGWSSIAFTVVEVIIIVVMCIKRPLFAQPIIRLDSLLNTMEKAESVRESERSSGSVFRADQVVPVAPETELHPPEAQKQPKVRASMALRNNAARMSQAVDPGSLKDVGKQKMGMKTLINLLETPEAEDEDDEVESAFGSESSGNHGQAAKPAGDDKKKEDVTASLSKASKKVKQPPKTSNVFMWTVVACFYFTTLGISTQFAISALYWNRVWGVGADVVGTIMAVGEVIGVMLLLFLGHPVIFSMKATRNFGKPVNVINATIGMGVFCLMVTIPNKYLSCFATVSVHACNVCVHSFQAELVGIGAGTDFAKWISRCYVVKRAANCTCVFGSLIFFEALGPNASYWVFGSFLNLYAIFLCTYYWKLQILPYQVRKTESKKMSGLGKRFSVCAEASMKKTSTTKSRLSAHSRMTVAADGEMMAVGSGTSARMSLCFA